MAQQSHYYQGAVDFAKKWGKVCGSQGNCEGCAIGAVRGTGITCQDFARQFPDKFVSLLDEMEKGEPHTFFEEYCFRFPNCNSNVELVSKLACRKAVFEGYFECEKSEDECVACWMEPYFGDITESESSSAEEDDPIDLDFLSD